MKSKVLVLLLVVCFLCMALPAMASNDVNGVRYRVNITMPAGYDHIYLYDQPSSSNGTNLGRIDNGEYVTGISSVKRKGYTWIYCNYNGVKGYIRKNNLVKVSNGSSSSSTSSKSRSSSPNGGTYSNNGTVSFSGNVNVRTGPGINYGILGSVSSGQTLNYAGSARNDDRGVAWYSVYYDGRTGWVSSKYSKRGNGQRNSAQRKLNNDVDEVLDVFDICALTVEYPGEHSSEGHLCRWEQSIRIYIDGNPRDKDIDKIEQFVSELSSNVTGLPSISLTSIKSSANMIIYFVPQKEFKDYISGYIGSNTGIFSYYFDDSYCITKVIIGVATDKTKQENRNHIIQEEIVGALGLPNNHWYSKKSILYQGSSSVQQLSGLDWDMLNILYSPKLKTGMEQNEIHRIIRSGNW